MAARGSIEFTGGAESGNFSKDIWGINEEELGFTATQSISVTQSVNVVEAKNRAGEVVGVITYDKRAEVTIEGIGEPDSYGGSTSLGKALSLKNSGLLISALDSSKLIITEMGVEMSNEDFQRYNIKGQLFELVTG